LASMELVGSEIMCCMLGPSNKKVCSELTG